MSDPPHSPSKSAFFLGRLVFMCGWRVYAHQKLSATPYLVRSPREKRTNREGELWCRLSSLIRPPTIHFFYIKFIHFFCMKFFSNIFFRHRKKRRGKYSIVNLCWCGCLGSVSVPDRARRRRETSARCLLLWKIEKNLYFFFLWLPFFRWGPT